MPFGYNGRILRVNLTNQTFEVEEPDEIFYRTYFGGRNFIAYYLLNELKPSIDPLEPDNKLIFATGVLTGAPTGGTGRNSVGAKSPLTGLYGEAEAGGFFGSELKKAGFDALIIEGKAVKPVYLWIKDGQVEFKDATHLWGKKVACADKQIKAELNDKLIRTALIGPGGEKLVRFACILNDIVHAYGRTGMGAVMGSKNLKGVAVRGRGKVEYANRQKLAAIAKWLIDNVDSYCGWAKFAGTPGSLLGHNAAGGLPTRNYSSGYFEKAEEISGEKMHATILVGRDTCFACPVRCKQVVEVKEPYQVDRIYGGPEYETLAAFGSLCGVSDLKAIAKANELCNANSLDTISAGAAVAFAMDCFEHGIITTADTEGLDLKFGNARAMLELVQQITDRQGLGAILAEGVEKAAQTFGKGAEKLAVHVKGQPLPFHDGRLKQGTGLGYALSPTGADHNHNMLDDFYAPGGFGMGEMTALGILEPLATNCLDHRKVRMYAYHTMWKSLLNCFGLCMFMPYSYQQQAELVQAVTGWNTSTWELAKVGERSINLTRIFNLREGMTAKDDTLPPRLFEVPIGDKGYVVEPEQLQLAIKTYYAMMGWDEEGRPTLAKLQELGIEWAGDFL
jgi:aldehyde:ferredoxin oxidoreductase